MIFIFLGIGAGYALRTRPTSEAKLQAIGAWAGRATTWLIWLLLFMLGIEVGANERIISALPSITQSIGQRYAPLCIYHGFVTDFTVPFLVTLWCA